MTTVKAAVYSGSEHLDIRDVDLREPGRGEVRVRIGASGAPSSLILMMSTPRAALAVTAARPSSGVVAVSTGPET